MMTIIQTQLHLSNRNDVLLTNNHQRAPSPHIISSLTFGRRNVTAFPQTDKKVFFPTCTIHFTRGCT